MERGATAPSAGQAILKKKGGTITASMHATGSLLLGAAVDGKQVRFRGQRLYQIGRQ